MDDELFRPTIRAEPESTVPAPWRPESIIYPAFFGGALAAMVLGAVNSRRLGLGLGPLLAIVAAGLAALIGRIVIATALDIGAGRNLVSTAAGLAVWLVVIGLQKRPFRTYMYRDREPASLVLPGIAAAVGCGVGEAAIVYAAAVA